MRNTQVEQNRRRSRRKLERGLIELDSFRIPALLRNNCSEIGKRFEIVWFALYQCTILLLCFAKPPLLLERYGPTELRGGIRLLREIDEE